MTLLTWLARAFDRLVELTDPLCADCQTPMTFRREEVVDEAGVALQRVYACPRCGLLASRLVPGAIPD